MEKTIRVKIVCLIISLSGCASSTISLNDYNQSYTQYKHIVDKRYDGSVASNNSFHTEGDRILKDLHNLSKIVDAGPYMAGTVDVDRDKLTLADSKFSIPPILSLDMALDSLSRKQNKTLANFELTAFNIRSQYRFLGLPNLSNDAECVIYANYRGAKLWTTTTTTFGLDDYNQKMTDLIEQCINSIIDRVNYHDLRAKKKTFDSN